MSHVTSHRATKSSSFTNSSRKSRAGRAKSQSPLLESLEQRLLLSVPSTWTNTGIGGTGTTYYPSINPWNHQEVWVGSDMGETFHTTTFGNTWQTPNYQALPGSLIPQYATNANTLYGFSDTLYKSTDGGATWSSAGLSGLPNGQADRGNFYVDTTGTNPNTGYDRMVMLGRDNKAYLSINSGQSWSVLNGGATVTWISGVFYDGNNIYMGVTDYVDSNNQGTDAGKGLLVSNNNGSTWTNFRTGLGTGEAFTAVSGIKDAGGVHFMAMTRPAAYVGTGCNGIMGGRNAPIWHVYSWNVGDGSWTNRDSGTDRSVDGNGNIIVAGMYVKGGESASGPATFYLASALASGTDSQKVIYKTTNMGATWTNVWLAANNQNVATAYENANALYMDSFSVSANDPNYVVWTDQSCLYGTTDGGANWAAISCDPAYRNAEGTYGVIGNYYGSSLNETSVWGLDFIDKDNIFASNTDQNGTHSADGGNSWAVPKWPAPYDSWQYNTTYKTVTAADGTTIVTVSGTHDCPADPTFLSDGYTNYGYGRNCLLASPDKGVTFFPILDMDTWPGNIFGPEMNGGVFQGANQADFSDAVTIYTINGSVPYCNNGFSATVAITPGTSFRYLRYLAPNGSSGDVGQIEFYDAAGNPIAKRSTVTAIGGGGVYHNDTTNYDYSRSFDYYTDGSGNKTDPIFGGYHRGSQANGCWTGLDLGAGNQTTITQIKYQTANLNPMVKTIAVDPSNPNRLYICVGGTDTDTVGGVWYSDNWRSVLTGGTPAGVTWTHLNNGLNGVDSTGEPTPNGMDEDLKVLNDGSLVLCYHGRRGHAGAGVWVLPAGQTTWVNRTGYYTDSTHNTNVDLNGAGAIAPSSTNVWDMRYQITSVTIDPTDATQNTWYANAYSYACVNPPDPSTYAPGLYRSVDRGQHWTKIFMPNTSYPGVFDSAINPLNKEIFVTTQNGLYYAADSSNPVFVHVDNFPFATPLRVYFNPFKANDIWVTTFGNGIYHGDTTSLVTSTPVAPTGLTAALVGPDQVKLTWANAAPYGDSFSIQTSPDGVNNWTTLGTIDSGLATSYITKPGALAAGTKYYFRIAAVIGANFSAWTKENPSVRTDMAAGSILADGFATLGNLNGYNGWTGSGTIVSPGLTFTQNGSTLTPAAAYTASLVNGGTASKNITNLTAANADAWVAFLANTTNGSGVTLKLCDQAGGTTYLEIGPVWGGGLLRVWPYVGDGYGSTGLSMTNNVTALVVMRIVFGDLTPGSKDTITAYLNPTPGRSFPDSAGVTFTLDHSLIGTLNQIQISGGDYGTTTNMDEIRIGRRFADVAPGTAQVAPSNPTGLSATAAGYNYSNRRVDLAWTNVSTNENGFWVDCDTTSSFNSGNLKTTWAPAGSNKFSFTDLTPATLLYFRVRPYNDGGTGTSNTASTTTTGSLATPPTGLTVISATGTTYTLGWTDSPDETSYKVEYAPQYEQDASFGLKWVTATSSLAANSTSYSFTIPTGDKAYVFRVSALNANGASPANLVTATIPTAPSNVSTVTSSSQGITVNWQDNSLNEVNFQIRYSTDQANWTTYATLAGKNATVTSISGLTANTQYYFQVRSLGDGGGASAWTASGVGRTLGGNTIAYDGFNYNLGFLDTDNGGDGWGTNNAWSAGLNTVTSGSLSYAPGGNTLYTIGNKAQVTGSTLVRNLGANLSGTFWLGIVFNQTSGGPTITLGDKNNPATNISFGDVWGGNFGYMVTAPNYYNYTNNLITANVTHLMVVKIILNSPNIHFELYADPTPGQSSPGTPMLTCDDIPLSAVGTLNQVRMSGGYLITTNYDELRVGQNYIDVAPIAPTTKPAGLSANAVSSSEIDLAWSDVAGESGYHIQQSTDQINWATVGTTGANVTTYPATNLSPSTQYFFRVSSYNNVGDSIYSDPANATTQAGSIPTVTATAQDASASETGPDVGVYRITRSGSTAGSLVVKYTTSGQASNTAGVDYNLSGTWGTATITAGNSYVDVTLTPVDDTLVETSETAILTISTDAAYTIGGSPATVTIADNDLATLTVSAPDASASETGPDAGTLRITSSVAMPYTLTVYYAMSGTASNTAGVDYNLSGTWGTATIAQGNSTVDVTLTPVDDTLVEGSETAILTVSASAAYTVGSPSNNTVTIADNDSSGSMYASDDFVYSVANIDGSSQNGGTGMTGAWAPGGGYYTLDIVSGNLAYSTLSADGNKLHIKSWSGTVSRSSTTTFGADGQVIWASFIMNIGSGGTGNPYAGMSIGGISVGSPTWQGGSYNVIVGSSTGGTGTLARGVDTFVVAKITYGATDHVDMWINPTLGTPPTVGSGTYVGVDGSVGTSNVISFTSGDSSMDDYFDRLRISDSWSAVTDGILPTVTATAQDANASETGPDAGVYRITRTGSTGSSLVVKYAMSGTATNTSDYSTLSGTATITAGNSYVDITLTPVDDTVVEASETAILTVSTDAAYTVGGSPVTVTIADNDLATLTASAPDAAASETGPDTGTFRITSSVAMPYSLTVYYAMSGTASNTAGVDYNLSGTWGTATITQGNSSVDVTLTPVDDTLAEGSETAILTVSTNAAYTVGGSPATVTIADNDSSVVYDSFNYTAGVTLNGDNGGIGWSDAWATNGPDQQVQAGSLLAGSPANTLATGYNKFYLTHNTTGTRHSQTSYGTNGTTIWASFLLDDTLGASGMMRIGDLSFGTPYAGNFSVTSASDWLNTGVAPTTGTTYFMVAKIEYIVGGDRVTLYKNPTPGNASPESGAIVGGPYTLTEDLPVSNTIVLTAGNWGDQAILDEVRIGQNYTDVAPAGPNVTVSATTPSAAEGGSNGVFTVTRVGTSGDLTVNYSLTGTATNGTDYTSLPGTVTIPNGQSTATVTVTVTDDTLAELKEYVDFTLTSGGYVVSSPSTASVSIADNDTVGLPASLKALWRLDEKVGTSATDTSTGGATADTGTLNGTPTWIAGKVGNALQLNGTSQYVQVANSNDLNINTSAFSISCWVKSGATNWNSTQTFVSKGSQYKFGGVSGGKNIQFSLYIGGAWKNLTYTNSGDISTSWHHYAATYDGTNMRIWVDGVNVATQAQTTSIASDTNVLYIGRQASTYLNGSIDEVRIYNACLTGTDITALNSQGNLSITGLTTSGTHTASYSVQSYNLNTGITQYGDVTKNFSTVVAKYLGSSWIKTAQADNSVAGVRDFLTFTTNTASTVYVMYDDAIRTAKGGIPTWLSQFTDTNDNIVTQQGTFSVYKLNLSAGTFSLGSNIDSGTTTGGMYNVLIVPLA